MEEKIFFYYTSDLHSHFENWPKIIKYFNEKKIHRKREKQAFYLLDNGDHVDRFDPIAEAMLGKANVELLSDAGYDVATIGNNEGITLDHDSLFHLYDNANFQLVCANLNSIDGNNPSWLKTTHKLETASGIKIGVIGLTAPFNAFYHLLGWHIDPPLETLDKYIKQLALETDMIVLLSHLGINDDEEIARRYPEIDVIVGGHTHHLFRDGEYINNTLLTAVGKHGNYVGEVILTWDHETAKLTKKEGYATNIDHLDKDQQAEAELKLYKQQANMLLNRSIVMLKNPLEADWFKETELMTKLVKTVQDWTGADCAFLNAGLILESLKAGPVSYGDVHRICPHPINVCVVELKGNELLEVIRAAYTNALMEFELKGFGFRGKVIGRMVFAGLEIDLSPSVAKDFHVNKVTKNGQTLNMNKKYKVATADMFTFGNLLPEVARSKSKHFYMPEFLRDLLVDALKKVNQ
ncbi:bifunctional metallophosphatase/5'-nucleotidase [Aquibacillus rhizosphaerae]|uniref:Bifunctional UDP-sugar hydrolase/5'-nucleotidase n=1 Tax=Aquibacillus rhizosphaerae TaxID=3051431 RepID=A0ABT7L259_9BACI|nr:bifunctional UDP-sugar hydrolase/5'-nucleotidase [Aquibacillus sp. LR5S19]MDL4839941.1 bifunctional UDP-sugar hydrolase/5'-nucleotidase [Aquibacillus sp. LR5S19]